MPLHRFLNLVYYDWVRGMTSQQREVLDGALANLDRPKAPDESNAPAWWHGEEEAYASSMNAVNQLRLRVGSR